MNDIYSRIQNLPSELNDLILKFVPLSKILTWKNPLFFEIHQARLQMKEMKKTLCQFENHVLYLRDESFDPSELKSFRFYNLQCKILLQKIEWKRYQIIHLQKNLQKSVKLQLHNYLSII